MHIFLALLVFNIAKKCYNITKKAANNSPKKGKKKKKKEPSGLPLAPNPKYRPRDVLVKYPPGTSIQAQSI